MFAESVEIDLSQVTDKEQFHDLIEEKLPCPDFYGRNMDAFHDVLTGCEEFMVNEIIFSGCDAFREAMPKYMAALEVMCIEATEDNSQLTIVFED